MIKTLQKMANGKPIYKWEPDQPGKYPCWIAWTGLGAAGSDISKVLNEGLPRALELGLQIPYIVFCTNDANAWIVEAESMPVIAHAKSDPNVDSNRLNYTGLSAGADAVLRYLKSGKDDFASFVIISINANQYTPFVDSMNGRPVRYFHGAKDNSPNLVTSSEGFVRAYAKKFNNCHRTVFANKGHNVWDTVYQNKLSEPTVNVEGDVAFVPFDNTIYAWASQYKLNEIPDEPKSGLYLDGIWVADTEYDIDGHHIEYRK